MTNVAVMYCKKIQDHSCVACAKCYKAMEKKDAEFGQHDEIELVAMTDCGDVWPEATFSAAARQEMKEEKRMIVATNMVLTEEERAPFWKVYDAYQADLDKINERLVKLLDIYAEELGIFTDEQADGILKDFLAIEEDRIKLKTNPQKK